MGIIVLWAIVRSRIDVDRLNRIGVSDGIEMCCARATCRSSYHPANPRQAMVTRYVSRAFVLDTTGDQPGTETRRGAGALHASLAALTPALTADLPWPVAALFTGSRQTVNKAPLTRYARGRARAETPPS